MVSASSNTEGNTRRQRRTRAVRAAMILAPWLMIVPHPRVMAFDLPGPNDWHRVGVSDVDIKQQHREPPYAYALRRVYGRNYITLMQYDCEQRKSRLGILPNRERVPPADWFTRKDLQWLSWMPLSSDQQDSQELRLVCQPLPPALLPFD
jgi:hypothetical protein